MAKIAEMQEVSLDLLRPYEKNAKVHGEKQLEQLANSIKEFGFLSPCLVERGTYNLIAGHGRVEAARRLGMETVPCVFVEDISDEQRRAYILADNRLTELGEWDMGMVNIELEELNDLGFDVSVTGFDFEIAPPEITEDDYTEVNRGEPAAKRGDIYQLGRHRVMCGDSTNEADVCALMNGTVADVCITSPPYGESKSAKLRDHYVPGEEKRESLYNEHDDDIANWRELIDNAFKNMREWTSAQYINIQMLADNKRDVVGFVYENADTLCDVLIWDKQKAPPQMQSNVFNNQFEFVFIFGDPGQSRSVPFADFHGDVNNVLKLSTGVNEFAEVHRAVFPVEFPASLLRISSKAKTVVDPFGGTGTTMMACEQLGRDCYTMEIDPRYVDVIIDRWEQFTGEKAVLLNG